MKKIALCIVLSILLGLAGGCASSAEGTPPAATPEGVTVQAGEVAWPREKLDTDVNGAPSLSVYVAEAKTIKNMDVESYVAGVLAGEMKNDWPLEALKAQAILARTFVLKFVDEKESRYEGADISTDIEEAQAYDKSTVNDRIRQAVSETEGMVLSANGELPYAWFHAHSGGMTEMAKAGLGWEKDEPAYTQAVQSNEPESAENQKDAQTLKDAQVWEASFSAAEFAAACRKQGVEADITANTKLSIDERGESGRSVTLEVDGKPVRATELRIALGSTKMRSTLLTSLKMENGKVRMAGRGYGHGVGMSQWGAYGMALEGKTAENIVKHYFKDVEVVKIW